MGLLLGALSRSCCCGGCLFRQVERQAVESDARFSFDIRLDGVFLENGCSQ